jgi:hypothetical protein
LPGTLLEDVTAALGGSDPTAALSDLLAGTDADAALGAVAPEPIATGSTVTDAAGEATFAYDGPAAGETGLDIVVACFEAAGNCASMVEGALQTADEASATAAGLWAPALLDVSPAADVGDRGGDHTVTAAATRADGQAGSDLPVRFEVWRADGSATVDGVLADLAEAAGVDLTTATDLQGLLDAAGDLDESTLAGVLDPQALADAGLTRAAEGTRTTGSGGEAAFRYNGTGDGSAVDVVLACPGEGECGVLDAGVLTPDRSRVPALGSMLWIDPVLDVDALTADPLAHAGEAQTGATHEVTATARSLRFDDAGTLLPEAEVRFEVYRTTDGALLDAIEAAIDDGLDLGSLSTLDGLLSKLNALDEPTLADIIDQGLLEATFDARVAGGTATTDADGTATFGYGGAESGDAVDVVVACPAGGGDCTGLSQGSLSLPEGVSTTATALWLHEGGMVTDLLGLL